MAAPQPEKVFLENATVRAAWVAKTVAAVQNGYLDGITFDWESPCDAGAPCVAVALRVREHDVDLVDHRDRAPPHLLEQHRALRLRVQRVVRGRYARLFASLYREIATVASLKIQMHYRGMVALRRVYDGERFMSDVHRPYLYLAGAP